MTVIATEYSIRDKDGHVLCHSAGATKANADSKRKRALRVAFRHMCIVAGAYDDTTDTYRDVVTGAFLPLLEDAKATGMGWVERGHVIADASNGAFCPCNFVPENRGSNKAHGNKSLDPRDFRTDDPRAGWYAAWMAHYATASKARRAVKPPKAL